MASGGARARSGPPPDPGSLRSAARDGEWVTLPPEPCEASPPPWPLVMQSDREADLWRDLWTRPQARMWHQLQLADEVALYCRYFTEAEGGDEISAGVTKDARQLVRQHREMLGLSTAGMARLKWRIAVDQVAERRETPKGRVSARDRLKAVKDGG